MKQKQIILVVITSIVWFASMPSNLLAAETHQGVGTIKTINVKERKLELDHGPIKSIGWMAMKMTFDVDDSKLLKNVKVGEKVNFKFVKTEDGRYLVTDVKSK